MKRRRKDDKGWMLLGFLMGPIGVLCIAGGILMLVIAVMI